MERGEEIEIGQGWNANNAGANSHSGLPGLRASHFYCIWLLWHDFIPFEPIMTF